MVESVCVSVCDVPVRPAASARHCADRFDLWTQQAARSHVAYPLVSLLSIYIYIAAICDSNISARSCREIDDVW